MLVRKFENTDFHSLIEFNAIVFKKRDQVEESIIYRFFKNPYVNQIPNEIIVAKDKNNKIVGQILVLPSELFLEGKLYPVFFGVDFFLCPEQRNTLTGIILGNKFKNLKYGFGIGLTDASLAIFKAFKYKIIGYMPKYIKINNFLSLFHFFRPSTSIMPKRYAFPDSINNKADKFIRVVNAEEITSKKGYWNEKLIEFTRNKDFINWRYFYYPDKYIIYKYVPYENNDLAVPVFFVVRPILWKKINCLLLVDYRFETNNIDMFNRILIATNKLANKLKIAATITGCSLPGCDSILRKKMFLKFGRDMEIVSNFETSFNGDKSKKAGIFATFADADCDFYYGSNKW